MTLSLWTVIARVHQFIRYMCDQRFDPPTEPDELSPAYCYRLYPPSPFIVIQLMLMEGRRMCWSGHCVSQSLSKAVHYPSFYSSHDHTTDYEIRCNCSLCVYVLFILLVINKFTCNFNINLTDFHLSNLILILVSKIQCKFCRRECTIVQLMLAVLRNIAVGEALS